MQHEAFAQWQPFEKALLIVGSLCLLALVARAGATHPMTLQVAIGNLIYGAAIVACKRLGKRRDWGQRLRFAAAYLFILWFYAAVREITPALQTVHRDSLLLATDRYFLGETPAARVLPQGWMAEVMSGAYLSYLVYLHVSLLRHGLAPLDQGRRFWTFLSVAYAVGFTGYLLVPATGPRIAFPELFSAPQTYGWLGQVNHWVVSHGSAVYDVFPSLHVLITCVVLDFEYRLSPRRFWCVFPLALLLFTSTVYLGYHYAVDLVAGLACFWAIRYWFSRWDVTQGTLAEKRL